MQLIHRAEVGIPRLSQTQLKSELPNDSEMRPE